MRRISLPLRVWLAAILAHCALGCSTLQRSADSGYAHRGPEPNYGREKRQAERDETLIEMGLTGAGELTDKHEQAIATRTALRKAEKQLEGRREREQYFKHKPFMKSDQERLEFLRLGSYEARSRWLNARGVQGTGADHSPEVQALIDINDITIGMTKQAVRDSWGEPELVEVAGNPVYANERWHYTEQAGSAEGYHTENRMVYFESGRVIGWETR